MATAITAAMAAMLLLLLAVAASPADAVIFDPDDEEAPTVTFDEVYTPLFGDFNLVKAADGRSASITLNRYSGSGFISSDYYHYGFFSAAIKLPKDHTAGVVVAFYLSNGDVFEKTHDELDLEFLGNRRGYQWRFQTNVYGNGSTDRGREERYLFPFDPTDDPPRLFSILWTSSLVVFYVDGVPIREVVRTPAMGLDFPTKPMAVYATIWDGSTWATDNGKYKINHKRGPFTAHFSSFTALGCRAASAHERHRRCIGPAVPEQDLVRAAFAAMTPKRRGAMKDFRRKYMTYTVCYDVQRFGGVIIFPECEWDDEDQQTFWAWGESKVVKPPKRRGGGRKSRSKNSQAAVQAALATAAMASTTAPPDEALVWRQAAD